MRSLLNSRLVLACVIAALAYLTTVGITLQSALLAGDRFGLSPGWRGAVVAVFGAAGLLAGRSMGHRLDRVGVRRFGLLAYGLLAAGSVLAGLSPWLLVLVAALAVSGVAGLAARVTVNSLAVRSTPDNRGGAASLMLACQFLGGAVAPLVLIPVYRQSATLGLAVGAVFGLVAGGRAARGAGPLGRRARVTGRPAGRHANWWSEPPFPMTSRASAGGGGLAHGGGF